MFLLLADVFEEFGNMFLEDYALNPCRYFKSPGFRWNAFLKKDWC